MADKRIEAALPARLGELSAKASDLPDDLRDALLACLSVAASDATPEQVLADAFARAGYLPREAEQIAAKILGKPAGAAPG